MLALMHCICLTTILLLFTGISFAKDTACDLLGTQATDAQIDVLGLADERDESHRDNTLHSGRAAERLLYLAAMCPDQFFAAIPQSDTTKSLAAWKIALRDFATLQPKERAALITGARERALRYGVVGKQTAQMLTSARVSGAFPSDTGPNCGSTFRHLLIALSDDWMARSGALWFDYSNSLLFMLASCPEDAFYVLDQRHEVLSSWLNELPKASFWGEAESSEQLRSLQKSLVHLLEAEHPPEYLLATRDEILHRMKTLCVTAIDETTPCEAHGGDGSRPK
jgi:hypothetical protein